MEQHLPFEFRTEAIKLKYSVGQLRPQIGSVGFEPGVFVSGRPDVDEMMRDWFSSHLEAMGEPPIDPSGIASPDVVRFLYLRSFHRPISVRLERRWLGVSLTAVELDGAGGYELGEVTRRISRTVPEDRWMDVVQLVFHSR